MEIRSFKSSYHLSNLKQNVLTISIIGQALPYSIIFQSANKYGCHAILHACFVLSFRSSTIIIGRTRRLQLTFAFHKGVYYEYGTRSEIICVQTGEDNGVTNALTVLCHGVGRKLKDVVIFTPR